MLRKFTQLLIVAALALSVSAVASAQDNHEAANFRKAQKLKLDARIAAERGDFATAVSNIAEAADLTGDRVTAERARKLIRDPQVAGGSPFADFTELIQLIVDQTINAAQDNWAAPYGQGETGTISIASNGVLFGMNALASALAVDQSRNRLMTAAEFAKTANHNQDVREKSSLRMVSLPRLEQHVQQLLQEGRALPDDIRTIAGIHEIQYLFVFPETQDIVIAGPAGDWTVDGAGRHVSRSTRRPTLNIEDLVTLTRTFSNGGPNFFMCTINPKQEHIAAVQSFVNNNQKSLDARTVASFTQELEQRLGQQNVIVQGIPHDSRVASVIVDCDYRMKEIGIGKRTAPKGMKSYFDLLTRSEQRGSGSMDALRWWMAVGYDAINMAPNGQVFEFAGNPIRCLSENQLVDKDGSRQSTGKADRANARFAELFTKHLPQLASQDPAFADLENIFDLALACSLVHSQGLAQQTGWKAEAFRTGGGFLTERVDVPHELMTAAAHRVYPSGSIVIQVAGGVRVDLSDLVNDRSRLKSVAELAERTNEATPVGQQNNRWWWDAAQR